MDTIKFSILIPAYKGKFLKGAVESIVNQTYKNWELIIVDDCSPEDLKSIVCQFTDPRIKYYRNDHNYGAVNVVDNWNRCLNYAKGEFVICMGDDDKLLPQCIEIYANLIDKYPNLNIFHGQTILIDEKDIVIGIQEARPEYESTLSLLYHRWLGRRQYIGDFLFKKSVLNQLGGFYNLPLAWGSDDISVLLSAGKLGIANSQVPVFMYRSSAYTISNSKNAKYKLDAIIGQIEWYRFFLKNYDCSNDLDLIYYEQCLKMFELHFKKDRIWVVSTDIRRNLFKSLMWIVNYKRTNLSLGLVFYSCIKGFRDYISSKYQGIG